MNDGNARLRPSWKMGTSNAQRTGDYKHCYINKSWGQVNNGRLPTGLEFLRSGTLRNVFSDRSGCVLIVYR